MAGVTLGDVEAELPQLGAFGPGTQPADAQVTQYIADITAEVQAMFEANGVPWPASTTSNAYLFLRRTILDGVVWLVYRTRYALSTTGAQPNEVNVAGESYRSKLGRMAAIARAVALEESAGPSTAGAVYPIAVATDPTPGMMAMSFQDWTLRRHVQEQYKLGALGYPWTLYPGRGLPW